MSYIRVIYCPLTKAAPSSEMHSPNPGDLFKVYLGGRLARPPQPPLHEVVEGVLPRILQPRPLLLPLVKHVRVHQLHGLARHGRAAADARGAVLRRPGDRAL